MFIQIHCENAVKYAKSRFGGFLGSTYTSLAIITLDLGRQPPRQGSASNFFRLPHNLKSCIASKTPVKTTIPSFQWVFFTGKTGLTQNWHWRYLFAKKNEIENPASQSAHFPLSSIFKSEPSRSSNDKTEIQKWVNEMLMSNESIWLVALFQGCLKKKCSQIAWYDMGHVSMKNPADFLGPNIRGQSSFGINSCLITNQWSWDDPPPTAWALKFAQPSRYLWCDGIPFMWSVVNS